MIYVNGDGFSAGSYVNSAFSWAAQDPNHVLKGQNIHPKNTNLIYSTFVANAMHLPVTNHSFEFNDHNKIIYETTKFVESNRVEWIIITWPNFFRGKVDVKGREYYFTFNQIENEQDPLLKQAMQQHTKGFLLKDAQADFTVKLMKMCDIIESKKIKYAMAMSDGLLPIPAGKNVGSWFLNPNNQNIKNWAKPLGLLNEDDYLNPQGHKEIAKLILSHLTNQL